jgi:hypothetical protein
MATTVTNTVTSGLKKLAADLPVWATQALNAEAEVTLTEAKKLTPVKTGRLRRSARVRHATPFEMRALLTYGTKYALAVHEIPAPPDKSEGGRSATHKPPTQWKYLETAVNKRAPKFKDRIATVIRKRMAASMMGTSVGV